MANDFDSGIENVAPGVVDQRSGDAGVSDHHDRGDHAVIAESSDRGAVLPEGADERGDVVGEEAHRHRAAADVAGPAVAAQVRRDDMEPLAEGGQVGA
jgi:hypothetical protein